MIRVAWRWAWPAGALVVEYLVLSFLVDFPLDGPALSLVSVLRLFVPVAIAAAAAGWLLSRGSWRAWHPPPAPRHRLVLAAVQLAAFAATSLLAYRLMGEGAPRLTPGGAALFIAAGGRDRPAGHRHRRPARLARPHRLRALAPAASRDRHRPGHLACGLGRRAVLERPLRQHLERVRRPPPARRPGRPHRRRPGPPRRWRLRGAGRARLLGRGRHRPGRAVPGGLDLPGAGAASVPAGPPSPAAGRARGLACERPPDLDPHARRRCGSRAVRPRRPSLQAGVDPVHGPGARRGRTRGARPLVPPAGRPRATRSGRRPRCRRTVPRPPAGGTGNRARHEHLGDRASGRLVRGTHRGGGGGPAPRSPVPARTFVRLVLGCDPPGHRRGRGLGGLGQAHRARPSDPRSAPFHPSTALPGSPSGSRDRCWSSRSSRNWPSAASSCRGWSPRTSRRSTLAPGPGPR